MLKKCYINVNVKNVKCFMLTLKPLPGTLTDLVLVLYLEEKKTVFQQTLKKQRNFGAVKKTKQHGRHLQNCVHPHARRV